MLKLGYKASAEQFAPSKLLAFSVLAEQVGFDSVFVSDHFQPWNHTGGHAPNALVWRWCAGPVDPAGGDGHLRADADLPLSAIRTRPAAVLTPSTTFPDRPRVIAEWTRLLKLGGRLLFTDPITLTGPLTNAEIAVRSSAGFYLFVPLGYDERVIAQCGLQLLVCEDVTANMAKVAEARHAARASRSAALREIEGDQAYDGQQEFLAVAARVAREGRLSRFVYVSKKLS